MTKRLSALLFSLLLIAGPLTVQATSVMEELDRVSSVVAQLELGFDNYFLGQKLTEAKKDFAIENNLPKALKGTYKFKHDDTFVIVSEQNDRIIGVYREYEEANFETLKSVIGNLMFTHGEPTSMAHDKMIYWTYDENGKIEQKDFDMQRQSGGVNSLVTVKFSSEEPIVLSEGEEDAKPQSISAYVMITSDPISKLFLAQTQKDSQ